MTTWLPVAVAGLALTALIVLGYVRGWRWIGVAEVPRAEGTDEPFQPAKTLWDWLQLLVIPLVLAALGFLLTTSQNDREQRREDQRAALQRSTAAEAAREEALSAYFRQMSALLLERELMTSGPNAAVRTLARTMTLGVLRRLDGERRTSVVRFLYEGRLLMRADPKVGLDGANLAGVNLSEVKLRRAHLRLVDLREADLAVADLSGAALREADLSYANLRGANVTGDLRGADLRRFTDLAGADLREANLRGVNLKSVDWGAETRWPSGFDRRRLGG